MARAQATPRPDHVGELKVLESAAFAADIHDEGSRGVYSIEAMREFYKGTVKYYDKDQILQEALARAEANYEQGGKGSGSVAVSNTMKLLAQEYGKILLEKVGLSEAFAYLTEGETVKKEVKELFDKYGNKTFKEVKEKDKKGMEQVIQSLMQFKFDKMIPRIGKRVRDSRLERLVGTEE